MRTDYIYPKVQEMINLTESNYKDLAREISKALTGKDFFNGSIDLDLPEFNGALRTTLIIYREPLHDPACPGRKVSTVREIVPVWWEFNTFFDGSPVYNDFSWNDLKPFLV